MLVCSSICSVVCVIVVNFAAILYLYFYVVYDVTCVKTKWFKTLIPNYTIVLCEGLTSYFCLSCHSRWIWIIRLLWFFKWLFIILFFIPLRCLSLELFICLLINSEYCINLHVIYVAKFRDLIILPEPLKICSRSFVNIPSQLFCFSIWSKRINILYVNKVNKVRLHMKLT